MQYGAYNRYAACPRFVPVVPGSSLATLRPRKNGTNNVHLVLFIELHTYYRYSRYCHVFFVCTPECYCAGALQAPREVSVFVAFFAFVWFWFCGTIVVKMVQPFGGVYSPKSQCEPPCVCLNDTQVLLNPWKTRSGSVHNRPGTIHW